MEPDPIELADLAATAKRYFRWDVLLLAAALGILLLNFQLMRATARQVAEASTLTGRAMSDGRGPAPDVATASNDGGERGGGRGDAVDGSTPMAEGTDPAIRPKPSRGRGVAQRPESDAP